MAEAKLFLFFAKSYVASVNFVSFVNEQDVEKRKENLKLVY